MFYLLGGIVTGIEYRKMNELNVIYQFNDRYVPYAGISITSMFINNTGVDKINVYILGEDLSEKSRELLRETAERFGRIVLFPNTEYMIDRLKKMRMIPYRGAFSVYLRLFFTEFIEVQNAINISDRCNKRFIYLDSDTIVNGSLLPLLYYNLQGKSIGMVLESIRDDYKVVIGMNECSEYFNSGVIVFDMNKWIENRYCERIVDYIQNVRSSYIGDQDFLNIVCEGDVCRLPLIYNFQPLHARYSAKEYFKAYPVRTTVTGDNNEYYSSDEIECGKSSAVIYHCYRWLGEFTWNKNNFHPFNELFDKYLRQSLWKDYEKRKAKLGFMLRGEKILYRILPPRLFIFVFKKAHEMMLKGAENKAKQNKVSQIS